MTNLGDVLLGQRPAGLAEQQWYIERADGRRDLDAYRDLRRSVFVQEQGLFTGSDGDDTDDDQRCVVLLARSGDGTVLGGVRLAPALEGADIGWWIGGRLAVAAPARHQSHGVGSALVRAACGHAESAGAIRFDATVQAANEDFFTRLGWETVRPCVVAGAPHVLMRWPIDRFARLAAEAKSALGPLLSGFHLGGTGFVGDDGAPVPGTDLVAACDAILPAMVERDPEWAGWCSVLVNVNDLSAMGASPIGLLDALGARDASFAARVLSGLRKASAAYGVPVLGGHTQLGVPAALSVTALGRAAAPVPGSGGRIGHAVRLTADLAGGWRRGYTGKQWDSTTTRSALELREQQTLVARMNPAAAKDVSMAGTVGTLGMLAEASGCGAVLDVAAVPRPDETLLADWLSCFPGFAMITADLPDRAVSPHGPVRSTVCGELVAGAGVTLRWPDGECTPAITGPVTGLPASSGTSTRNESDVT